MSRVRIPSPAPVFFRALAGARGFVVNAARLLPPAFRCSEIRKKRRGSQVVRQRSAKPLFASSILARASNLFTHLHYPLFLLGCRLASNGQNIRHRARLTGRTLVRENRGSAFYATSDCLGTREGAALPPKTASMLSSASIPMAERVSTVALPICGNRNVFLSATYPG